MIEMLMFLRCIKVMKMVRNYRYKVGMVALCCNSIYSLRCWLRRTVKLESCLGNRTRPRPYPQTKQILICPDHGKNSKHTALEILSTHEWNGLTFKNKTPKTGAETEYWVKGLTAESRWPEFDPWNCYKGERRELNSTKLSPDSHMALWHICSP